MKQVKFYLPLLFATIFLSATVFAQTDADCEACLKLVGTANDCRAWCKRGQTTSPSSTQPAINSQANADRINRINDEVRQLETAIADEDREIESLQKELDYAEERTQKFESETGLKSSFRDKIPQLERQIRERERKADRLQSQIDALRREQSSLKSEIAQPQQSTSLLNDADCPAPDCYYEYKEAGKRIAMWRVHIGRSSSISNNGLEQKSSQGFVGTWLLGPARISFSPNGSGLLMSEWVGGKYVPLYTFELVEGTARTRVNKIPMNLPSRECDTPGSIEVSGTMSCTLDSSGKSMVCYRYIPGFQMGSCEFPAQNVKTMELRKIQ